MLKKAGSNWVVGDRFFDRESELEAFERRVRIGAHTLLTAQSRMGKTSLVRELFHRLEHGREFVPVFVDLEAATSPEDAITELGFQCRSLDGIWGGVRRAFGVLADTIDEASLSSLRFKFRSNVTRANWSHTGDAVIAKITACERPTVLAIDELPMLVATMLKGHGSGITPERLGATKRFLGWLRKNGQLHRDKFVIIASGSVGLQPILQQGGLTAYANIFSPFELKPWSLDVASACLKELAQTDRISLSSEVRREMCSRLRCCVPHHVQQFYFYVYEEVMRENRREADMEDVDRVYREETLGSSGQTDLYHYESRLRSVLGSERFSIAWELLTEAAVNAGFLPDESINRFVNAPDSRLGDGQNGVWTVLGILEHDGYFARESGGYRFVSALVEDWWKRMHGTGFVPLADRVHLNR